MSGRLHDPEHKVIAHSGVVFTAAYEGVGQHGVWIDFTPEFQRRPRVMRHDVTALEFGVTADLARTTEDGATVVLPHPQGFADGLGRLRAIHHESASAAESRQVGRKQVRVAAIEHFKS